MEDYSLKIYPAAQGDFRDIVEYLNTLSCETATQYFDLLTDNFETLLLSPGLCPLTKDLQLRLRGYRMLATKEYIVLFILNRTTVEIHRILFNKRQYEGLL